MASPRAQGTVRARRSPRTSRSALPATAPASPAARARRSSRCRRRSTPRTPPAIPAALAAAQAKAKTKDDHYVIAQLQLKAAVDAKDNAGHGRRARGGPRVRATCRRPNGRRSTPNLGKLQYNAKAYDKAGAALRAGPEARSQQCRGNGHAGRDPQRPGPDRRGRRHDPEGDRGRAAAGQKADETWYKRAVALSFNAKLPTAPELGARMGRRLSEPEELARHDPHLPDAAAGWTMRR